MEKTVTDVYACGQLICPAISSYSFGTTAIIFCRMFIHIMEVCMSTGFWWSGGRIICVFPFMQLVWKTLLSVILRIFKENQNPVDMHTSIMCINILQNIIAVAPKSIKTMIRKNNQTHWQFLCPRDEESGEAY
jgi:uncharacterized membrane protein